MLLPGGPFHFVGQIAVAVKDAEAAGRWYEEVLNLSCVVDWNGIPTGMTDHKNKSNPGPQIMFVAGGLVPGDKHPVIFANDVESAHRWFSARTATVSTIENDSGGNSFFSFVDLDGNRIEVCADPQT